MISTILLPRYLGDSILLFSYPTFLAALRYAGHGALSLETQVLMLLTFVTRYTDLCHEWHYSKYRFTYKAAYLLLSAINVTALLISMSRAGQKCRWPTLLTPIVVVAIAFGLPLHYRTDGLYDQLFEFLRATSQYMGAMALVPQLILSWTRRFLNDEPIQVHRTILLYLSLLLLHQLLYCMNWMLRYENERMLDPISIFSRVFRLASISYFLFNYQRNNPEGQLRL